MRRTRWEWLAKVMGLGSRVRRQRPKGSGRPKNRYRIEVNGQVLHLDAYTAGEARAEVKAWLGISVAKGRLPVGAKVTLLKKE